VRRERWALLAFGLGALTLTGCDFFRGHASGRSTGLAPYVSQTLRPAEMGAAYFVFGDFGGLDTDTLETNAVPWKLVAAALVMERWPGERPTQDHLHELLSGFGFIYPSRVGNWPLAAQPEFSLPLGIVGGDVTRALPPIHVNTANLGCASCHSGVTYDAQGRPTDEVWLGLPNTSLDLDAYVDAVLSAVGAFASNRDRLLAGVVQLFPETSEAELGTIRRYVWPKLLSRVARGGPALPFRNGGPGRSNGVGALRFQLGIGQGDASVAAGVSIPELGDQLLRRALLTDGVYTRRGDARFEPRSRAGAASPERLSEVVAFFTVPTMGLHPERAAKAIAPVGSVMTYLAAYEAPKFPGSIDATRAASGARVYAARCAACHGEYEERDGRPRLSSFPNRRSALAEIGTDAARLDAVDDTVVSAVARTAMGRTIDAARTGGYVAPSLSGVWATAPYLHNGSVPTLWHLMHPEARPERFWVGGHALSLELVGVAGELDVQGVWTYPAGAQPWSTPRLFDTRSAGCSHRGHEAEFAVLGEEEKRDALEFLKRL
jgi:mono/diheme cytochrome c family protein